MRLAHSQTLRFAGIAAGVGATPIPVADILVLMPLQILLVAIIAGLSCRELSWKTGAEFLSAAGVNLSAGFALREVARALVKFIPVAGEVISGAIAGAGTYGIGKAAELYFFTGAKRSPKDFQNEWKAEQADLK
jgi:uncharacterized protein (DUF697 family)